MVAGYDVGGDGIKSLSFMSGNTDSIRANEGFYLGLGASIRNDAGNLEFVGTLSMKYQGLHADNGDITWIRYPLDALVLYRARNFRLGGGLTYAMHPRLKGTEALASVDTRFDNALGAVLQGDLLLGRVNLGLRYTILDYTAGGSTFKSNGLGATFGFTF